MGGFARSSSSTSLLPSLPNFTVLSFKKYSHTSTTSLVTRQKQRLGLARTAFLILRTFPPSPRLSLRNQNLTLLATVLSYSLMVLNQLLPSPPVNLMNPSPIPSMHLSTKRLSTQTVPEMPLQVGLSVHWRMGRNGVRPSKLVTLWVPCVFNWWDRSTSGRR